MIEWPDAAILYGMFFQHTEQLGLKWRDCDRQFAINLKAKTASQHIDIAAAAIAALEHIDLELDED